jgi:hypothetical protein
MSVRYEKFLPEVIPYVHDCPEFVAVNAIRNACIEFCDKSLYLQYTHDPISVIQDVPVYTLDLPTYTMSARVMDGWFDNLPLTAKSEDQLKRIFPMDWREMQGRPQWITQLCPEEIIIAPKPFYSAANSLKLIVAIKPTRDSTTVDSVIYDRWAEHIGFGAKARLYDTPNHSYSDPGQAVKFRSWFENAIGEAKTERNRGLTRSTQVVRPPRLI